MPSAKSKSTSSAPPEHVIRQLRKGELVDFDTLGAWYTNDCPQWLKQTGLAPDVAALLASPDRNGRTLPDPTEWGHVQITGRAV